MKATENTVLETAFNAKPVATKMVLSTRYHSPKAAVMRRHNGRATLASSKCETEAAGRGQEPHRTAARQISKGFTTWISDRLVGDEPERHGRAALLRATFNGLFLLHSVGCEAEADAAAPLAE